jgi:26S proteasome regulatory subunit N1
METDTVLAPLVEHVENRPVPLKTVAIMGLGVPYVGSHCEDLLTLLLSAVADDRMLTPGFVAVETGRLQA